MKVKYIRSEENRIVVNTELVTNLGYDELQIWFEYPALSTDDSLYTTWTFKTAEERKRVWDKIMLMIKVIDI